MWKWLRREPGRFRYPPSQMGEVFYAVGDIHGRLDCLRLALLAIDKDKASNVFSGLVKEIYIGDYIDRGPDSRGVIEALIERSVSANTLFLLGNHEILLKSFLGGDMNLEYWRPLGGLETARSYGASSKRLRESNGFSGEELAALTPPGHLRFLDRLKPYVLAGRYCFVHAGLRPGVALEQQKVEDLAWIREDFLDYPDSFGPIVVHGHTPVADIEFRHNRINIDTGAYVTNRLSVIRIDGDGVTPLEVGRA